MLLNGRPKFLGYIPQGFKVYGGTISKEHSFYISRIESEVQSQIVSILRLIDPALAHGTLGQFRLGEIQDFASLMTSSQRTGLPIYFGTASGTPAQRESARMAFESLARKVEGRIASIGR